jgi:hypothetical protein
MSTTTLCRWCGEAIRKSGGSWRHAKPDNGRCEVTRRQLTGDAKTPIEPA